MAMHVVDDVRGGKVLDLNVPSAAPIRVLRIVRMLARVGIGRATAYDWMNPKSARFDPTFPRPIRLSGGAGRGGSVGWIEHEISNWIESRVAGRDSCRRDRDIGSVQSGGPKQ